MSVKILSWVWHDAPQDITGNDLVLLLALADVANDSGECIYFGNREAATVPGLATKVRVSRDTLIRSVKKLQERGVLEVKRGRQHDPNSYRILLDQTSQVATTGESRGSKLPVQQSQIARPEVAPVQHHSSIGRIDVIDVLTPPIGELFETFYLTYPRRAGKAAAKRKFETLAKKVDPQLIIAGARRFRDDPNLPEAQFVPHPATWLNQGRWEDDPLPPRYGGRGQEKQSQTLSLVERYEEEERNAEVRGRKTAGIRSGGGPSGAQRALG
jgi:hypothetical protein